MSLHKNNHGNILLVTLLMLSAIIIIALGMAILIDQGIYLQRTQRFSTVAYFTAEKGAERILYEVRKGEFDFTRADGSPCQTYDYIFFNPSLNPSYCGGSKLCCVTTAENPLSATNPINVFLLNGEYFNVQYSETLTDIIFTSTGTFRDVKRLVEVTYLK